jgi:hypothetical protein
LNIEREFTNRLLADVVEAVGCCVDDLALNLVGPSSVVPQATSSGGNIDVLGHAEGLAVVESLDGSNEVGILLEQIGKLVKQLSPVLWCLLSPWAVEGFAGGSNSDVNILLGGLLNTADDLLSGGVDNIKGLAVNGLYELIVDEAGRAVSAGTCNRQYRSIALPPKAIGGHWGPDIQLTVRWAARTRPSGGL